MVILRCSLGVDVCTQVDTDETPKLTSFDTTGRPRCATRRTMPTTLTSCSARSRGTGPRSPSSWRRTAASSTCTATGCSGRTTTPRTPSRTRCSPRGAESGFRAERRPDRLPRGDQRLPQPPPDHQPPPAGRCTAAGDRTTSQRHGPRDLAAAVPGRPPRRPAGAVARPGVAHRDPESVSSAFIAAVQASPRGRAPGAARRHGVQRWRGRRMWTSADAVATQLSRARTTLRTQHRSAQPRAPPGRGHAGPPVRGRPRRPRRRGDRRRPHRGHPGRDAAAALPVVGAHRAVAFLTDVAFRPDVQVRRSSPGEPAAGPSTAGRGPRPLAGHRVARPDRPGEPHRGGHPFRAGRQVRPAPRHRAEDPRRQRDMSAG